MGDATPVVGTCPTCGARLLTPGSWHSCGTWSLEALFEGATPGTLRAARRYVDVLEGLGDVQVLPQRTRLTCVAVVRFAGLEPRRHGFVATFALRGPIEHPRIVRVEQHAPGWWTHRVRIESEDDVDDELAAWLRRAHDTVGLRRDDPLLP